MVQITNMWWFQALLRIIFDPFYSPFLSVELYKDDCVGNLYEKSTDAKTDDANDGEVHRNEMAKNTLYIPIVPGQSKTHQIIF